MSKDGCRGAVRSRAATSPAAIVDHQCRWTAASGRVHRDERRVAGMQLWHLVVRTDHRRIPHTVPRPVGRRRLCAAHCVPQRRRAAARTRAGAPARTGVASRARRHSSTSGPAGAHGEHRARPSPAPPPASSRPSSLSTDYSRFCRRTCRVLTKSPSTDGC